MPAIKLAEILYARLLGMGFNPVQHLDPTPAMELSFYTYSSNKQLTFQIPGEKRLYQNLHGSIFLMAPVSITHLSNVDPKKIGKAAVSKKYLSFYILLLGQ